MMPTYEDEEYFPYDTLGDRGIHALWSGFIIMVIATIVFTALSWRVPVSKRFLHVTTTIISVVSGLSYLAMTSGYGDDVFCRERKIPKHSVGEDGLPGIPEIVCRLDSETRHYEWIITSTLLIINLGLVSGLGGAQVLVSIVSNLVLLWTGKVLVNQEDIMQNRQKWAWILIALVSYGSLLWNLGFKGFQSSKARSTTVRKGFTGLFIYAVTLWTIQLGIHIGADGGGAFNIDDTAVAFTVLDVLLKPVFGLGLLLVIQRVPAAAVEFNGYWTTGSSDEGLIRLGADDTAN